MALLICVALALWGVCLAWMLLYDIRGIERNINESNDSNQGWNDIVEDYDADPRRL